MHLHVYNPAKAARLHHMLGKGVSMVELLRVDDRLLHGQVAYAWSKSIPLNLIVIANDAVAVDKARKATFALSKPAGVKLVISTVEKTVAFLNSDKAKAYSILVLVDSMHDARVLAEGCADVAAVNLGGLREHGDSKRYTNAVCLTDADLDDIRAVMDAGKEVYAQQVPADTKVSAATFSK